MAWTLHKTLQASNGTQFAFSTDKDAGEYKIDFIATGSSSGFEWFEVAPEGAMNEIFDTWEAAVPGGGSATHGGSGWSGSLNVISQLEPEATMAMGFSVSRERSASSADNVKTWLQQINMISK